MSNLQNAYHDNRDAFPETKVLFADGLRGSREAIYDGASQSLIADGPSAGSYNYVSPMDVTDIRGLMTGSVFAAKGAGHYVFDMAPPEILRNLEPGGR